MDPDQRRTRGEEWGDLEEEDHYPELYQASGAPQVKNPKREEPLEKNLHRREEQDKQRRTTPMMMRRREESRTSSPARNKSRTPLPQSTGGGRQKAATDNFNPHDEEGTQEEKAVQRTPPIASLESARKCQEAETLVGQEQLAKIVRPNTHRGNCRRTPHEVVVRARQLGCIPRGTQ